MIVHWEASEGEKYTHAGRKECLYYGSWFRSIWIMLRLSHAKTQLLIVKLYHHYVAWVQKGPYNFAKAIQISFVEIGDEHIFKLKIQKGTWSYLLSIAWPWIALFFFITRRHKFGPKGLSALTRFNNGGLSNFSAFFLCDTWKPFPHLNWHSWSME